MDASAHISDAYWNRCMADDVDSRDDLVSACGNPSLLIYAMEYMRHGNFNVRMKRLLSLKASIQPCLRTPIQALWAGFAFGRELIRS